MGISLSGASPDTGFAQRMKALACTAPLHDLDARKSSVQQGDYTAYQMAELALQLIDLVTIAMDFETGAHPAKVVAELARNVRAQAPERLEHEHAKVARWVLENLLNIGSADRGFRTIYGISSPEGYSRRSFDFKLLEEAMGTDGDLYLRASDEAINVLVGALEVDIESAQYAADLRLEALVKKGRLLDAQGAAQNARYRTIQYGETLRQRLDATTRDVRNVDWITAMPAYLDEALSHIEGRYQAENAILLNITDIRDNADTGERKEQAATLIDVVRDCLRRHDQLQSAIQSAGRKFRSEQDRQAFTNTSAAVSLDLHGQVLKPALGLSLADADVPSQRFFAAATGLTVPFALRLIDLFDGLSTPPTERDLLGEVIEDPELDDVEEPSRFTDRAYEHLQQLLDLDPDAPQRLSGLLADARARVADDLSAGQDDPDEDISELPLLVVIRVLAFAAQEIGAARRHHEQSVLMAIDDGAVLDDPDFSGADLLVTRAVVIHAAATGPDRAQGSVSSYSTAASSTADGDDVASNGTADRAGAA